MIPQTRLDVLQQQGDPFRVVHVVLCCGKRGFHRATALVAQNDEQRRTQVQACVLQSAHDLCRNHVAGDPHDEQFPEARVEDELGRDARVAAAENGGVRTLPPRELGEDLFLNGREACLSAHEARVTCDQPRKRFVRCIRVRSVVCRGHSIHLQPLRTEHRAHALDQFG